MFASSPARKISGEDGMENSAGDLRKTRKKKLFSGSAKYYCKKIEHEGEKGRK